MVELADKSAISASVSEESLSESDCSLFSSFSVVSSLFFSSFSSFFSSVGFSFSTPIIFSEDYSELTDPVGILKTIKEVGAFKKGTSGSKTIDQIGKFGDKIMEIPGKQGLNAFVNTNLEQTLRDHGVEQVLLAGTVASICIDSTGRSAFERGFKVTMLSDCISGRTVFEKDFYFEQVFPLYAEISSSEELVGPVMI